MKNKGENSYKTMGTLPRKHVGFPRKHKVNSWKAEETSPRKWGGSVLEIMRVVPGDRWGQFLRSRGEISL